MKYNINTFSLVILSSMHLYANISGVVYEDLPIDRNNLNTYGIQDSNELGIPNVTVKAYPSGQTVITDKDGKWSLPINQKSRIEFTNWPTYLKESPLSRSIQFLNNNSTANLGLYDPRNYSDSSNPFYIINRQLNGSSDNQKSPSIEFMHYQDEGLNSNIQVPLGIPPIAGPVPLVATKIEETGSIWGKAIQKNKKRIFASTVLQRHIDFAPDKDVGEIYVIDYQAIPYLQGSFSLQGKQTVNGGGNIDLGTVCRTNTCINTPGYTGIPRDYLLNQGAGLPNIDLDAFKKVGKISYGDITFDEQTNKLWLVNLYQRALISLDVSEDFNSLTNTSAKQYPISNIGNVPLCNGGILRPWAIKIHHDKLYLGAVCDASISQNNNDLKAYVLSTSTTNPTIFEKELEINLNYNKDGSDWNPWSDIDKKIGTNWKEYIQPILSNIEFDKHNNMYLSFLDRYGLQSGYRNYAPESNNSVNIYETNNTLVEKTHSYGEIFKVCYINKTYVVEGNGACNQINYPLTSEFFNDIGGSRNPDASMGSIAILRGSNQILATIIDPHPEGILGKEYWNTLGSSTLSLNNGSIENWYSNLYSGNKQLGYNGKAQGMGEIEILTASAPIEIGDRIWLDSNANGIQDATENGIPNVTIQLIKNNHIISTTISDSEGYFLFSSMTSVELTPANTYSIRVPNINGVSQQPVLKNLQLTLKNIGQDSNRYQKDSDAQRINQNAEVKILPSDIPFSGANNHSFDVGFKPNSNNIVPPINIPSTNTSVNYYSLGDKVWLDSNRNGIQENNESGINNITVNLYRNNNCTGNINLTTLTQNGGLYRFNNLVTGTYCIEFVNLPENYTITTINQGREEENSDANTNAQITNIQLIQNDLNEDMGIYPSPIVAAITRTSCSEMHLTDDESDANRSNATTIINVLNNDLGNKDKQTIKLINSNEGKILWEEERLPTSEQLFDTVTIENEGVWSIQNNQVLFTAYDSFNGQIPTPIYYVILGENCTEETQYSSNVAQITITSPCNCPDYTNNSVSISNLYILYILIFTSLIVLIKKEELEVNLK